MKKYLKNIALLLVIVVMGTALMGCRQSDRVSYNLSKQADSFNVTRRLAVLNARSDEPIFELVGNFAISNNSDNELVVTVEVDKGVYKKHFVYLNQWTIYVVEDVGGAYVDPYHYEVNFLPEMIAPVTFTSYD